MKAHDFRIVLDDDMPVEWFIEDLIAGQIRDTDTVRAIALLNNDGFGHLLPSRKHRAVGSGFKEQQNEAARLIDRPD